MGRPSQTAPLDFSKYEGIFGLGYFDIADEYGEQREALSELSENGSMEAADILVRVVKEKGDYVVDLPDDIRAAAISALGEIEVGQAERLSDIEVEAIQGLSVWDLKSSYIDLYSVLPRIMTDFFTKIANDGGENMGVRTAAVGSLARIIKKCSLDEKYSSDTVEAMVKRNALHLTSFLKGDDRDLLMSAVYAIDELRGVMGSSRELFVPHFKDLVMKERSHSLMCDIFVDIAESEDVEELLHSEDREVRDCIADELVEKGESGVSFLVDQNSISYLSHHLHKEHVSDFVMKRYPDAVAKRLINHAALSECGRNAMGICEALLSQGEELSDGILESLAIANYRGLRYCSTAASPLMAKALRMNMSSRLRFELLEELMRKEVLPWLHRDETKKVVETLGDLATPYLVEAMDREKDESDSKELSELLSKITHTPMLDMSRTLHTTDDGNRYMRKAIFSSFGNRMRNSRIMEMKVASVIESGEFDDYVDDLLEDYRRPPHRRRYNYGGRGYWRLVVPGTDISRVAQVLFPLLMAEASKAPDPAVRERALSVLKASKHDLQGVLSGFAGDLYNDYASRVIAQGILDDIDLAREKAPVIVEKVSRADLGWNEWRPGKGVGAYDMTLRVLHTSRKVDRAKLFISDAQGRLWAQNCDSWGNQDCKVKAGFNYFRIYLHEDSRRSRAHLRYYRSGECVGRSNTFTIGNPNARNRS